MVSKMRAQRIADRVRDELSIILLMEVADPRLEEANISHVNVDRELAYADIYVSALSGVDIAPEIIEGLKHAKGFLRSELARRIQLRAFPKLRFHWDPSPEHVDRIDQLIASIHEDETDNTIGAEEESSD